MRALGWEVPRSDGERVRRRLSDTGWLRTDLKIRSDGTVVTFPIRGRPQPAPEVGAMVEAEFLPSPTGPPSSYRTLLGSDLRISVPPPRAFDVIGDIVLVRLSKEQEGGAAEIGRALLEFVPGARLVGLDRGVHGTERIRRLERIAGAGPWTTRHVENGLSLDVDLERAYFSPRLGLEHRRAAATVEDGQTVFDLCAGIGPFSLLIARRVRTRRIVAVDSNPEAIRLLRENAARLRLERRIETVEAPIEGFLPTAGRADRVVFNLPREGNKYLAAVGRSLEPGGMLRYYEVTCRSHRPERAHELALALSESGAWSLREERTVHPYSPSEDLVVYLLGRSAS